MRLHRQILSLTLILGVSSAHAVPSSTHITGSRKELLSLKSAVETLFHSTCPRIERQFDGRHSLSLETCLPARITELLGRHASIGGPNCYDFALYSLGVIDALRPLNSHEVDSLVLSPTSEICSRIESKTPAKPGEIISLEEKISDTYNRKIHAYVFLTKKYALTKNGPDTESTWELATVESILQTYPVAVQKRILARFHCSRPADAASATSANALRLISDFSKFMSALQLNENIPVEKIKNQISEFSQAMNEAVISSLAADAAKVTVQIKIHELVSHFYAIKSVHNRLPEQEAESYKPYAELYLEILDRLLNTEAGKFGIEDVSNTEDGLEYEYCGRANNAFKKICNVGEGH